MDAKGSWQSAAAGAAAGTAVALGLLVTLGAPADTAQSVTIQTFQFKPTPIDVPAGTRVSFTNQDDITHTVTSGTPESPDGKFSHRLEGKGASFTVRRPRPARARSHEARCLPILLRAAPVDARRDPRQVTHSPGGESHEACRLEHRGSRRGRGDPGREHWRAHRAGGGAAGSHHGGDDYLQHQGVGTSFHP